MSWFCGFWSESPRLQHVEAFHGGRDSDAWQVLQINSSSFSFVLNSLLLFHLDGRNSFSFLFDDLLWFFLKKNIQSVPSQYKENVIGQNVL